MRLKQKAQARAGDVNQIAEVNGAGFGEAIEDFQGLGRVGVVHLSDELDGAGGFLSDREQLVPLPCMGMAQIYPIAWS